MHYSVIIHLINHLLIYSLLIWEGVGCIADSCPESYHACLQSNSSQTHAYNLLILARSYLGSKPSYHLFPCI